MSVRKLDYGKWQADAQPGGRLGKRIRKTFTTRREAEAWLRKLEEKPELAQKETRRLSALIKTWYELHGSTLRQGYNRLQVLERLCKALGDPLARKLSPEDFASYRRHRIEEGLSENSARNPSRPRPAIDAASREKSNEKQERRGGAAAVMRLRGPSVLHRTRVDAAPRTRLRSWLRCRPLDSQASRPASTD